MGRPKIAVLVLVVTSLLAGAASAGAAGPAAASSRHAAGASAANAANAARAAAATAANAPAPAATAHAPGAANAPAALRATERPCPDSIFTCVTLTVPRDHFAAAEGPTFRVTFAIHRATAVPRRGVFVTVTGGPGTSGIAAADGYTAAFDPRVVEDYDIVFLDQRGIGLSAPLQCPAAALAFYSFPGDPAQGWAQGLAYAAASRRFARDCVAETRVAADRLPWYSTRQAVEDLEAFRAWLGSPKLDLYGESYGTQYVQTYAAAHPGAIHGLFVDGPVDLTRSAFQYYAEDAHAFEDVLSMTLDACSATDECRADVPVRDALAAYDELARRLRAAPRSFSFVTAEGAVVQRRLAIGDLETAAAGYVYSTYDRMLFQRALAQASQGNLLPMARLAYISLGQDPETLEAVPDPTWSDAMYYAVECMDYDYRQGSPAASAARYLAAGSRAGMRAVRLGSVFYGDLPCAFWPAHPATSARPAPLERTPYPVFVLASTTDPATPYAGALRIYRRLADAYLVVQPGGPHIIFGRGNSCPDDIVTSFLLEGKRPAQRRITCDYAGVDAYVPIPARTVAGYADALAAMTAVDDEINNNGDYWSWDGADSLRYGCLDGGTIAYEGTDSGADLDLRGCAFSLGLPLTGSGTLDMESGAFALAVTGPGGTSLRYARDADGRRSVEGTWFGSSVSLAAAAGPMAAAAGGALAARQARAEPAARALRPVRY